MGEFLDTLDGNRDTEGLRLAGQQARAGYMAIETMAPHLERISGDSNGSCLEDFFDEADVAISQEALTYGRHRNWPNAVELSMQKRRSGKDAWSKPEDAAAGILTRPYRTETVWSGKGYYVGDLEMDNGILKVMLCTDGRLRCWRNPSVFVRSQAWGYGTLPEPLQGREPIKVPGDKLAKQLAGQFKNT